MRTPLKILHVIHGFGTGGAETWLVAMLKQFRDLEMDHITLHFLATGGEELTYDKDVIKLGGKIHYITFSVSDLLGFRLKFKELLKRERFDVIHDHQDFVSGIHYILGIGDLPSVRVSHLHNPRTFADNYVDSFKRKLIFKIGRFAMAAFATHITGTSEEVMDQYGYNRWPYQAKRVEAVYCGIDVDKFRFSLESRRELRKLLNIGEEKKICLFVGRIGIDDFPKAVNQKNPEFAFRTAKELVSNNTEWYFLFVGYKGIVGSRMEKEVTVNGLSDRIRFLGVRNDVSKLMSAADVFIFPSVMEGLGMVMVEAQASGLPAIASENIPREAVVDPKLVNYLKLSDGPRHWAKVITDITLTCTDERGVSYEKVSHSPFAIRNSVLSLLKMYTSHS